MTALAALLRRAWRWLSTPPVPRCNSCGAAPADRQDPYGGALCDACDDAAVSSSDAYALRARGQGGGPKPDWEKR